MLPGLRAWCDPDKSAAAVQCAAALLGARVTLIPSTPLFCGTAAILARLAAFGPCVGVLLETGAGAQSECAVVELSAAFAEQLVDRALGGEDGATFMPTLLPPDALSCGALAYLAARVLAALDGPLRLRHVSPELSQIVAAFGDESLLVCPFEVQLGDVSGGLRVYLPPTLLVPPPRDATAITLTAIPLTLIAELGGTTLLRAEISELRVADIVVLEHCRLTFDGFGFCGQVMVHVAGSRSHVVCNVRERSLEVERLSTVLEPKMTTGHSAHRPTEPTESATPPAAPNLADDAPLELHVELARFSLTLGELQRTRPGDVLVTGRRVGEAVTLRVAGRVIAQGELVDVDGEVGVRLTQFTADAD